MSSTPIKIDAEDGLLLAIGHRLLSECADKFKIVGAPQSHSGHGGIRKYAKSWNKSVSKDTAHLVLMDMDSLASPEEPKKCPATLIRKLLSNQQKSDNFLLRIAVYESESWLIADWVGIKRYFKIKTDCNISPDRLENAKQYLRDTITQHAPPAMRNRSDYRLRKFVNEEWNPNRAQQHSKSLRKTLTRLKNFPH